MSEDLVFRLKKRAEIRRQISTRKSVQEGKADRIADLLEEAAQYIEDRIAIYDEDVVKVVDRLREVEKELELTRYALDTAMKTAEYTKGTEALAALRQIEELNELVRVKDLGEKHAMELRSNALAQLTEAHQALEAWSKWKAMETQEEQRPGSIGQERLGELLGDAVEKNWKVLGKKGTPQAFEDALRKQVQEKTYDEAIRCCDYVINLRSMFTPDFVAGAERVKGMLQAEKENGGPLTTQLNQIDKKT